MSKYIDEYNKEFQKSKNIIVNKKVSIIGIPLSEGQELEGVHLACDDLRRLGLYDVIKSVGWDYEDVGDVKIEKKKNHSDGKLLLNGNLHKNTLNGNIQENTNINGDLHTNHEQNSDLHKNHDKNKCVEDEKNDIYYNNIKNVEVIGKSSENIFKQCDKELKKKNFVLNIGGDHSIAFATILSSVHNYENLKLVWIDAHGDINVPETSPSMNYHGMPLAHALNLFKKRVPGFEWSEKLKYLKPENVALIGIRDIDEYEKIIIKKSKINYYSMFDIDMHGMYNVCKDALEKIDPDNNSPIHVSLDIDSIDVLYAPATGTLAKGGLTYREIHLLLKMLADTKRVVCMDLVEYNPLIDVKDKKLHCDSLPIRADATVTGKLCLEMIARILGNNIT
ncbi:arginase [Hepatocystis sp. ex Piliocolobus tephrosceles]|nr:arginase [Hepatocystis sp. ex Piliocolobus tephrosceles]